MAGFAPFPPPPGYAKLWPLYLAGSIAIDLGIILVLILFGTIGGSGVYSDISAWAENSSSASWSEADGLVSRSHVYREGSKFGAFAEYTYHVGEAPFSGQRVAFAADWPLFDTEADAARLLSPFGIVSAENELTHVFDTIRTPTDRRVIVFFNPSDPASSVLRREFYRSSNISYLAAGVVLSCFGVAVLVGSFRSWRRYLRTAEYRNTPARSRLPK